MCSCRYSDALTARRTYIPGCSHSPSSSPSLSTPFRPNIHGITPIWSMVLHLYRAHTMSDWLLGRRRSGYKKRGHKICSATVFPKSCYHLKLDMASLLLLFFKLKSTLDGLQNEMFSKYLISRSYLRLSNVRMTQITKKNCFRGSMRQHYAKGIVSKSRFIPFRQI